MICDYKKGWKITHRRSFKPIIKGIAEFVMPLTLYMTINLLLSTENDYLCKHISNNAYGYNFEAKTAQKWGRFYK